VKTLGQGKIWREEIRNTAKDGSYYWGDTTIVSFLNEKEKPYQYVSIPIDVIDRKQAEEAIRVSEAKYRFIAENIQDLISYLILEGWSMPRLHTNL
jgi:PAS domain-containing protein